jgi:protein AFG1
MLVLVRGRLGRQGAGRIRIRPCSSSAGGGPLAAYSRLVAEDKIREDAHQRRVITILDQLSQQLSQRSSSPEKATAGWGALSSIWDVLSNVNNGEEAGKESPKEGLRAATAVKGVYMYGGVGCGKSFLMDLFMDSCSVPPEEKQRVHFLEWMTYVHRRLHIRRKEGLSGQGLMSAVVDDLMSEGWLLCFDEFQVTDVADAMVIRQLFSSMWQKGLVMVATSNRPPRHLYHNGLQRDQFLPFIAELERQSELVSLEESSIDYRLLKGDSANDAKDTYLCPIDRPQEVRFEGLWDTLTNKSRAARVTLSVAGRRLEVSRAVIGNRLARFTFHELCGRALGSEDYRALAESFHTIFLEGLPVLSTNHLEPLRRFILLIDTLYDRGVKLVVLAEAEPADLLPSPADVLAGKAHSKMNVPDELFAFDRTVSRLMEMRTHYYLSQTWGSHATPGKDLLIQFEGQVMDTDMLERLWQRYDLDCNGSLDKDELLCLMRDVMDVRSGHRNVPERLLELTFNAMDPEGTGHIAKPAFIEFGNKLSAQQWWGSGEGSGGEKKGQVAAVAA